MEKTKADIVRIFKHYWRGIFTLRELVKGVHETTKDPFVRMVTCAVVDGDLRSDEALQLIEKHLAKYDI